MRIARTLGRAGLALALVAAGILGALMLGDRDGSALGLRATWTLTGRIDATQFKAGPNLPLAGQSGFEIISFGAVGPTAGLGTYVYSGADLAASLGGPQAPFVSCKAGVGTGPGTIVLDIENAFPYSGCVYFPTVKNTGQGTIRINFGSLTQPGGVFCGLATCKVDIVAAGWMMQACSRAALRSAP